MNLPTYFPDTKIMLFKILFYSTLLIPIIAAHLAWKTMGRLGMVDYITPFLFWIAIPICVIWFGYFIFTKDFVHIWMPIGVLLLLAFPFVYGYITQTVKENTVVTKSKEWLQRTENKHFSSDILGISFDYVSERPFSNDKVSIKEDGNIIRVLFDKDKAGGGSLLVSQKDPNTTLASSLQKKYSKDFPECKFVVYDVSPFRITMTNGFVAGYEFVRCTGIDGFSSKGCPRMGIEIMGNSKSMFIMDKGHPEKYIYITLPSVSIEASKPTEEDRYPIKWYESIVIR